LAHFKHSICDMRFAICDKDIASRKSQIAVRNTIKEIVNPLLIGNITTVGAFLSLLFISSDAMRDLGLFASFLLVGTIVFVLVFLPHFLSHRHCGLDPQSFDKRNCEEVAGQARNDGQVFGRLAEFSPEKNRFIVLIFLLFTAVLFFFSFGTKFETNLHVINYMTDEQRAEVNKLIEQNQGKGKTLYVVTEGENINDALRIYDTVTLGNISRLSKKGLIENHSGISNFFPSKELQKQKIERWNEFLQNRKENFISEFNKLSEKQGFNRGIFDGFIETLNKDFQPQEFEYFTPVFNNLGENYFSISDDKTLIYSVLECRKENISEIERRINISKHIDELGTPLFINFNVFTFDDTSIAQKMVEALSDDFNNVLYICAFIVFAFLFFSFGRIELAIMTFIPLTVAWIWILGLMNIFDLKFNIVNIILATFIFGQGDDYTIFVTEGLIHEYKYRKKMLASFKNSIILSATILFIAIGMLIFAKHPAMRSLAELTIVGMISVVMCAYLFPPLIFSFLTTKKGQPREMVWTLKRFLRSIYAFIVFLSGSLMAVIYGVILLGFRKKPGEKNKLRYHRFLQWASEFVLWRIPDVNVKFRYENLSGETFDKPAVIISNHQSYLDLMCLMTLTPKLIILTNDRMWNSPFFGRAIRYADFYPVSNGIENSIGQLSEAVQRGYSIVVFPEGTRSADCSIGRFHRGAFYLAETLKLDIVPVFLHGVGGVLPKKDFLLREGQMTMQVRERITPNDSRFAADYSTRTKQIRQYYREVYAEISQKLETLDYFKSFVLHNYMYKGVDVWRGAKKEMRDAMYKVRKCDVRCATSDMRYAICDIGESQIASRKSQVVIKNNGYGVYSFMYALAHKDIQVIAIEEDEDKVAIARNCAGIPKNLKIYNSHELCELSQIHTNQFVQLVVDI